MGYANGIPDRARGLDIIASAMVVDYSASSVNSYLGLPAGLGTPDDLLWENLVETPADANVRSKGPLKLDSWRPYVTTGTDPVFSGNPGRPESRFVFSGDCFMYHTGFNAGFVAAGMFNALHRDQNFQFNALIRYQAGAANQTLFSTKNSSTGQGVWAYIDTSGKLNLAQQGATGAATTVTSTAAMTDGEVYCISIDHDHSGNTTGFRVGTSTRESVAQTFNASASGAPSSPLTIGAILGAALTSASLFLEADSEIYELSFANALISDATTANVYAAMETRSGMDGTP